MFRAWPLLLLTLPSAASATRRHFHGVFNSSVCRIAIAVSLAENDKSYRAEARRRHLMGVEITEFSQRKARRRLLTEQELAASTERMMGGELFRNLRRFRAEQLASSRRDFERIAAEGAEQLTLVANEPADREDGPTYQERFPFLFSLIARKRPIGEHEEGEVETLLFLRSALHHYRVLVSADFVDLPKIPMDRTIAQLRQESDWVERVGRRANDENIVAMQTIAKDTPALADQMEEIAEEMEWVERCDWDFAVLTKELLTRKDVPLPVQEEIAKQVNFDEKYGYEPHVYFKIFLMRVKRYLEAH